MESPDLPSSGYGLQEQPWSGSRSARSFVAGTAGAMGSSAVQESAILATVRRQMEMMEERLGSQISRIQMQSDRLRDVALSRLDAKVHAMDQLHPKVDRRIAELSGNFKGLSDEMQSQIRRVDQMDSRLWEWRHSMEEEIRGKFSDAETNHQQISSDLRVTHATSDDALKRLNKRLVHIESSIDGKVAGAEDTNQSLLNLHRRLQEVEAAAKCSVTLQEIGVPQMPDSNSNVIAALEFRLQEACDKIDRMRHDVQENHTRVETQEERLKSLRTVLETRDEHFRGMNERLERSDWDGRFRGVDGHVAELKAHRMDLNERLEVFQKKLEAHEQMHEETTSRLRSMKPPPPPQITDSADDVALQLKEYIVRVTDSEHRMDELVSEVEQLRTNVEVAPRIGDLVESLKVIAPRLIDQEESVRELHDRVGRLDAQSRIASSAMDVTGSSTLQATVEVDPEIGRRIRQLESSVGRLTLQMEGEAAPALAPAPVVREPVVSQLVVNGIS
jgi:hypothetical protein